MDEIISQYGITPEDDFDSILNKFADGDAEQASDRKLPSLNTRLSELPPPKPKDLNAPKKNTAAYFIFSDERRTILSKQTGKSNIEISKIINAEWSAMDPETKQGYVNKALEQRKKYLGEKEEYKNTTNYKKHASKLKEWKQNEKDHGRGKKAKRAGKPRKKPAKPENMPKKPLNSSFIFNQERRNALKIQYPDKKQTELNVLIADEWKAISKEDKKIYEQRAAVNRERYHKDMAEYKKSDEYKNYKSDFEQWKKSTKRCESGEADSDDEPEVSLPRKPKDPNAPKRPLTGYILYMRSTQNQRKAAQSNEASANVKKWKELSEDEKKPYNDEAARLQEQYKIDIEEYRGSEPHKQYKQKLQEWKEECDKRKKAAANKLAKKKAAKAVEAGKITKAAKPNWKMEEDHSDVSQDVDNDESGADLSEGQPSGEGDEEISDEEISDASDAGSIN